VRPRRFRSRRPRWTPTPSPSPSPVAVALLQKPGSMGLREYLMDLTGLAVLATLPTTTEFLA
jgi:hypothetical protein